MNYVIILWSGAAAAAFMLALVHALVWAYDRQARASAALAIVALSVVGIAFCELGMMGSQTPEEFNHWVRWCHLPLFFLIVAVVCFIRLHFGAGSTWLLWSVIGTRTLILVANFSSPGSFNFQSIESLRTIRLFGSSISVIGVTEVGKWQWLGLLNCMLLLAFIADATRTRWRRGDPDAHRNAIVVGGSVLLFVGLSVVATQLTLWQLVHWPILITPPYLFMLLAMAFELSRDTLGARRLLTSLRESDHRLELAVNSAQIGLWSWESRRGTLWATLRARQCFGFGDDEALSLDAVRARIHADDHARMMQGLRSSIERGLPWGAEFRVCPEGSGQHWIAAQGEVVADERGHVVLVRGVVRDITEQKRAQAETAELRREVNHAGRVSMLGQLSSSLAHELSQPLGAILRNVEAAEILLGSPSPDIEELRAIIADIHTDDRRAGDIIDRLRALLKRRQLQFQPLAIEALVGDVSTLVRADAASRHIDLTCCVDEDLPPVSGDRVHLSQVLINLLLNGMDAIGDSPDPRRRLALHARPGGDGTVTLSVTDTGGGIAEHSLARIFDPFYTTKEGGMGMGLAVSRTIVEAHGGQLQAANAPEGGAVFVLSLPVARDTP